MSRFGLGFVSGQSGGNDQYTKVLLHMDGANGGTVFTDSNVGGSAHTWTSGGATTSTSGPKFGTAALAIAANYISTPANSDFNLGSSDFTFDGWIKTTDIGTYIFGQSDNSGTGGRSFRLALAGATSKLQANFYMTGFPVVTGGTNIGTGAWTHFALVRTGNILRLFVNGVQDAADVAITGAVDSSPNNFAIGRFGEYATLPFTGQIDEFRFSVGIARWTTTFTPPTSPYF